MTSSLFYAFHFLGDTSLNSLVKREQSSPVPESEPVQPMFATPTDIAQKQFLIQQRHQPFAVLNLQQQQQPQNLSILRQQQLQQQFQQQQFKIDRTLKQEQSPLTHKPNQVQQQHIKSEITNQAELKPHLTVGGGDSSVTLWQFLWELLQSNQYKEYIQWTNNSLEFKAIFWLFIH